MRGAHGIWIGIVVVLGACRSTERGGPGGDVVRLTNGGVVHGRIVEDSAGQVAVDTGGGMEVYPRSAVYGVSYSPEGLRARQAALGSAEARPLAEPGAPSSWYPRGSSRESVEQREVLWFDKHLWSECVGEALAAEHERIPELTLFAPPGGRLVFHDLKKWGYHAHVFPGDGLRKPVEKPGMEIELSPNEGELPEAVAFVSPAQEMVSTAEAKRASYAPPDVFYARVLPLASAGGSLGVQSFAGGRAAATAVGTLWAFALPRNASQFVVYLLDPDKKHGEILKAAFAGYGETVLSADFAVDAVEPGGVTVGRVLVVPFPDGLSADGPAPEAVTVYAGPREDPTAVVSVPVPPRQAVQLPPRVPSTRADVLVSHYEVSRNVPQTMIVAHGVGRPSEGVSVVSRELTSERPDEVVKIDLSSLPEERFPAVAWFYHRRTYAWKSAGGWLGPREDFVRPALGEARLTKVKRNVAIPYVQPIFFQGPRPAAPAGASTDPFVGVAGGMSHALMQDALARERGFSPSSLTSNLVSSLAPSQTSNLAPSQTSSLTPNVTSSTGAGAGTGLQNTTYVTVVVPPHTPGGGVGLPALPNRSTWMGRFLPGPSGPFPGANVGYVQGAVAGFGGALGPMGTYDPVTGVYRDPWGQVVYDPRDQSYSNSPDVSQNDVMFVDPTSGAGIRFTRGTR